MEQTIKKTLNRDARNRCQGRMYKAKENQSHDNLNRVGLRSTLGNGICGMAIKYNPFPAWVYLPAYGLLVNPRRETPRKQGAIEMTHLNEHPPLGLIQQSCIPS